METAPSRARLLRPGKFAEQLARRLRISGVRGLRCLKNAKMISSPILVNGCAPSRSVSRGTLQPARITSMEPSVCVVLRHGCTAQVSPAVVRGIAVAMVNHHRAPFAGYEQPGELVCSVLPARDRDFPIAVFVQCSGNGAGVNRSAHPLAPTKLSGLALVMQQLTQPRARHSRTSSHGYLAK